MFCSFFPYRGFLLPQKSLSNGKFIKSSNKFSPKILGIIISHVSFQMTNKEYIVSTVGEFRGVVARTIRSGSFLFPFLCSSCTITLIVSHVNRRVLISRFFHNFRSSHCCTALMQTSKAPGRSEERRVGKECRARTGQACAEV